MFYPEDFKNAIVKETKRRLINEGVVRIKQCLEHLTEGQIWHQPNQNSNSVGNIILHLCGNVRQWILTGLAGQEDNRERDREFELTSRVSAEKLVEKLDKLMKEVSDYLDEMPVEILLEKRNVQGFEETGLSILIHVVEHFSYHVGQITYYVKAANDIDMQYYGGVDLNFKQALKTNRTSKSCLNVRKEGKE